MSLDCLDTAGESARGWRQMKGIENKKGWYHFIPVQIWEGTLYHNHQSHRGTSSHERGFLSFYGIGIWWEVERKPKKKGICVVSVGSKHVWWGGEGSKKGNLYKQGWWYIDGSQNSLFSGMLNLHSLAWLCILPKGYVLPDSVCFYTPSTTWPFRCTFM